ncbi:isoleucine--tRNA ligase, cytoplasmic [Odontomachus brunneus]|uniref:isoleucine--tRNA ligase, cytoplasmic n=1 Tax=Odontomachus brunneus TaxID=486640 RepID=UPI0013F1DC6A|nr:isoleucine--tRNA ligase, cytoplasmic [Odontomachus brunneus]XP_032667172.1 isoleucine--tRNA ligase, cytoplasmic [Odontomachus brunneus]XP_032667184.1 isoleucine--tRNA ligase, cytoplasmic [Odontomachus brunneus]XP_032667194.1 isoleucine--tRNA ligase, cytoplasmic [Odontomachus brunneus]
MCEKLPETIDFPKEEEAILELWKKLDVFQNSLRLSKNRPKYSFYDGPPFATGLPHYGHILAGTIKDIITRYAYQRGFHVERRFGWDTHGLPVEYEIDKTLGLNGPDDVEKMGIAAYNDKCRSIVMRYAKEWQEIVYRVGRWIDFKNDYKTMYPWYMESIWWVFKELYNKGLVYQGIKVMPYSTACNTPLSNFEAGQNYKDVVDPSVIVTFPLLDEPNVSILAWTTTPWTLPSNLALCANPTFEYVEVKDNESGNIYIILEAQLELVFKSQQLYTVIGKRKGTDLKGKAYEPLFPYFIDHRKKGAFRVLNDTYVTAETGTGIVHQAPYFGEDDYRCCLQAGVITKDQEIVCPVDSCGRFVEPVRDFLGKYVKDADKEIIKYLQAKKRLLVSGTSKHSYPFCWRSDTPLIYKAVPSWFIRVEQMRDKLLEANSATYWVPDYVKDKRFGNWLRDARDWAISRNRYWGNPIPLWISEDKQEIVCVGSIDELERLTNTKVTDIHRENIDQLTIPSKRPGQPPLRRIPEVFDCWFESGSMPYAQIHYPFEREEDFHESFPADFIGEGIDQTRGWFYTLLVISTALFGKAPFKNLIANGLVLASDGQKMSKRKKNYPNPIEIVNKYGADALRLYLINSPVVRAENLRFKEEGVRDVIKDVFLPWYNAFRFLMQNVERFEKEEHVSFVFDDVAELHSDNIMDKWIVSFTQTLLGFLKQEMQAYRLYTVIPHLIKYIDNLTNWYVRMNRKRIKGESGGGNADCRNALNTLFLVLYTMVRTNAPFTPFLTEFMFQRLSKKLPPSEENMDSVHYQLIPDPRTHLIDVKIERSVSYMQTIIELGRVVRDRKTIPTKYPLPEVVVIHQDSEVLRDIVSLDTYILGELNVKRLTVTADKEKYGVMLRAEPDHKTLGARLKGEFKRVTQAIKELTDEQLRSFVDTKEIVVCGHTLEPQDLRLMFSFTGPAAEELSKRYEAHSEGNILILLDVTPDKEMHNEGIAREVINRVQKLRKKAQLIPSDDAVVYYEIKDASSNLAKVVINYQEFIENVTKTPQRNVAEFPSDASVILEEMQKIKGMDMKLVLVRGGADRTSPNDLVATAQSRPFVRYVNVLLVNIQPRYGAKAYRATILLNTPKSSGTITYKRLRQEIELIFGIYGISYDLYLNDDMITRFDDALVPVQAFDGQTLKVVKSGTTSLLSADEDARTHCGSPVCDFVNVKSEAMTGSVLLENPKGDFIINDTRLKQQLGSLFEKSNIALSSNSTTPTNRLCGQTLEV